MNQIDPRDKLSSLINELVQKLKLQVDSKNIGDLSYAELDDLMKNVHNVSTADLDALISSTEWDQDAKDERNEQKRNELLYAYNLAVRIHEKFLALKEDDAGK